MNINEFNVIIYCKHHPNNSKQYRTITESLARVANTIAAGQDGPELTICCGHAFAQFYDMHAPRQITGPRRRAGNAILKVSRSTWEAVKLSKIWYEGQPSLICPVYQLRDLPDNMLTVEGSGRRGLVIVK